LGLASAGQLPRAGHLRCIEVRCIEPRRVDLRRVDLHCVDQLFCVDPLLHANESPIIADSESNIPARPAGNDRFGARHADEHLRLQLVIPLMRGSGDGGKRRHIGNDF
jgi:hypothetical protein